MTYTVAQVKDIIEKSMKINSINFIGSGNHSEAFCINENIVVKFPKHQRASECLKTEMKVLLGLEQKTNLDIPNVLFDGAFPVGNEEFVYFASKRLRGKNLSRAEFLMLGERAMERNAEKIAEFLYRIHHEKRILPIRRKDLCLLHGDFSLNHVLFDEENIVCGVLDFADSRVGKPMSDFVYLLDGEDEEEFGVDFGNQVLRKYENLGQASLGCLPKCRQLERIKGL